MKKKLGYELKEKLVEIGGSCFWYWKVYQAFLESCGVKRDHFLRYKNQDSNKYNLMRQVLSDLEEKEDWNTIFSIQSAIYNLKNIPDKNIPDQEKSKRVLNEFKEICGEDLLERKLKEKVNQDRLKAHDETIKSVQNYEHKIKELHGKFIKTFSEEPQKRGYILESVIYELFSINEIHYQKPFKSGTDQIDGHFRYGNFDYLVEIKWEKDPVGKVALSVFNDEIQRRIQSTRGLFVSMSGFNESHVKNYEVANPKMILMDGEDISLILEGRFRLDDALNAKIDKAVKAGQIYFKLRNL
jgi:hypothetical protein